MTSEDRQTVVFAVLVAVAVALVSYFGWLVLPAGAVEVGWRDALPPSGWLDYDTTAFQDFTDEQLERLPQMPSLVYYVDGDAEEGSVTVTPHRLWNASEEDSWAAGSGEYNRRTFAGHTLYPEVPAPLVGQDYGAGCFVITRNATGVSDADIMMPWVYQSMPFYWANGVGMNTWSGQLTWGKFPSPANQTIWASGVSTGQNYEGNAGTGGMGSGQGIGCVWAWHFNGVDYDWVAQVTERVSGGVGGTTRSEYAVGKGTYNGFDARPIFRDWYGDYNVYGDASGHVNRRSIAVGLVCDDEAMSEDVFLSLGGEAVVLGELPPESIIGTPTAPQVPPSSVGTPSVNPSWYPANPTGSIFGTAGSEPSTTVVPEWLMHKVWTWWTNEVAQPFNAALGAMADMFWPIAALAETGTVTP